MNPRRFTGAAVGLVTNLADPEKQGRIKVRFPWLDDEAESHWCRISASQAGNSRGNFVRPEVGDEVLVMFERGDVHQPWVVGVLWNGKDAPPGPGNGDGKNDHKFFQSRAGHQMIFNDGADGGSITFHDGKQRLHTKIDVPGQHIHSTADSGYIKIEAPAGLVRMECKDFNLHSTEKTEIQVTNSHQITVGGTRKVAISQENYDQIASNSLSITTPKFSLDGVTLMTSTGSTSVTVGNIEAEIQPKLEMELSGPVTRTIGKAKFNVQQFRTTNGAEPSGPLTWTTGMLKIQGEGATGFVSGAAATIMAGLVNATGGQVTYGKDAGGAIGAASLVSFLGGLMLLNPAAVTMPATKMLDPIMGFDAHTTGPAPIPAPPIPFHPFANINPILLDVRLNTLVNFRPAAGSGATSVGVHMPPIPVPPWPPIPLTFRPMLVSALTALFLAPFSAAVEMVRGMVSANQATESPQAVQTVEDGSKPHWFFRTFPMFASPGNFIMFLVGLLPFPVANGSISIASPSVQWNDTPAGLAIMPFCNTCSDIPVVPNAMVMTFSNVMVGIDLAAILDQLFWNAVHGAVGYGVGRGLAAGGKRIAAKIKAGDNPRLQNVTQKVSDFLGFDACIAKGHPVDVVSGTLFDVQDDVSLCGTHPLVLRRFLNAKAVSVEQGGVLGIGWRLTLDQHLTRHVEGDRKTRFWAWHTPDMRVVRLPDLTDDGEFAWLPKVAVEFCRAGERLWDVTGADGVAWRFEETTDGEARLASWSDRNGNTHRVEYDSSGAATGLVDASGRRLRFEYAEGNLAEIWLDGQAGRWAPQRLRTYRYDAEGRLVATAGGDGQETTYRYDERDRLTHERLPTGYTWHFHYDGRDCVTTTYGDDLRYHFTFDYAPEAGVSSVQDGLGRRTRYQYDEQKRVTAIVDPEGGVTQRQFDEHGQLLVETDPAGGATAYEYDERGRVVAKSLPGGGRYAYVYDVRGHLVEETDPCGAVTRYVRDGRGNVVRERRPDGGEIMRRFDERGRLLAELDARGVEHLYVYDDVGNLVSESHDGSRTRHRYDAAGRRVESVDAAGGTTTFVYDPAGRLTRIREADGAETRLAYDALGNLSERTTPDGRTWRFEHDGMGRLVGSTSPAGRRRLSERGLNDRFVAHRRRGPEGDAGAEYRYAHDACDRLIRHETADGVVERYEYDPAGRLVRTVLGDGADRRYLPGPDGRPLRTQTRDGFVQQFKRDALGRAVEAFEADPGVPPRSMKAPPGAPPPAPRPGERRVALVRRPDGAVVQEVGPHGRVQSRYGAAHRLLSQDVDGARLTIERDQKGRPVRVRTPDGGAYALRHEAGGGTIVVTPGGATIRQSSDRVVVRDADDRIPFLYRARYDGDGRRVADVVRTRHGAEQERRYTFDGDGLLDEPRDAAGNRLLPGLRYAAGHRLVEDAHGPVDYDDCGRVRARSTADGRWRYRWDDLDRLFEAEGPDGTVVRYRYDAFHRLVERIEDPVRGPVQRRTFLWNGDRLAGEHLPDGARLRYLVLETDAHTPWACFVEAPDGTKALHLLHADARGAVIAATDPTGHPTWSGVYDAYGRCEARVAGLDLRVRLPGQWEDPVTGLHYNRFRWYQPDWGRYLSPDPLGVEGDFNRYAYAAGDPVHRVDPLGLMCDDADTPAGSKKKPPGDTSESTAPKTTAPRTPSAEGGDPPPSGLDRARAARDAKLAEIDALPSKQRNEVATVVGVHDPATGEVAVGVKRSGVDHGKCAEDLAAAQLPGNPDPKSLEFTEVIRPRNDKVIPRCDRCTETFGPEKL